MSDTKKPTVSTYEVNRYKKMVAEHGAIILEKWPDSFPGGAELINRTMNGDSTNKEIRAALLAHKIHIAALPKKKLRDFLTQMSKALDITGERFGRLTVLERYGSEKSFSNPGVVYSTWICRCDCGNEKVVRGTNLRSGMTQSCGCLRKEKAFFGRYRRERERAGLLHS